MLLEFVIALLISAFLGAEMFITQCGSFLFAGRK